MNKIERIISPAELINELPSSDSQNQFIHDTRIAIENILHGKDDRLLLIIGPCSIHDLKSAHEYALKLRKLSSFVQDRFLIVMRVYLEKPRSTIGWKGLIHDPFLNGSHDLITGLKWARELLLELSSINVAAGTEFLEFLTPCYLGDLISWGSIGARTCSSQPHRQLASGLPMPIGFKNALDGDPASAVQAVQAAKYPQACITISHEGHVSLMRTKGNPHGHVILRGSSHHTNYDAESVNRASSLLQDAGLLPKLIVDCSHGNCKKNYSAQEHVFESLISQIVNGSKNIVGLMLESHLNAGSQIHHAERSQLHYAISLTDPCISWKVTEKLILWAYKKLKQ
jgi:3-deoxy-7-phosphoheptulonate synthase